MRRHAVARITLAIAFVVAFIARLNEPFGVDQGLFACFTRWVPRGALPYRDLFDSKPPLFLYWWSLPSVIPGELHRAIWIADSLWLAGTMLVAHRLAARLFGARAALATAALLFLGLWAPGFGGYWSRAQAEELLALPMLASVLFLLRDTDRDALVAGVLVGVCGLFKIPSMSVAGAFGVYLLAQKLWRRLALVAAGVVVPWALILGWFAAHGATGRFFEGVFQYHRYNAQFIAPPWDWVLATFVQQLVSKAGLLLVAASMGAFLLVRRRARLAWLFVPWALLTMAAVVLQRQLADYHYLLPMPALAVLGGYGVAVTLRAVVRQGRARVLAAVVAVALAGLSTQMVMAWLESYGPGLEHALGKLDRASYLRRVQQGNYSLQVEEDAARYLREHARPEEGVLVWGLSPGIYPLADRHPVTRYPFHKILFTDAPLSRMIPGLAERRAELMERIARDPPVYVLVGRGDANGFEPMDSQTSLRRFAPLSTLVERDYALETTIGRFLVYRRKP